MKQLTHKATGAEIALLRKIAQFKYINVYSNGDNIIIKPFEKGYEPTLNAIAKKFLKIGSFEIYNVMAGCHQSNKIGLRIRVK